ncbi:hypothetical protein CDL12_01807 [Handroanthus impetiginosus]|uniref:DUF3741 domain-containing protein n=1 Tax=Handroanthus impetiginosus TaxID=429701 RepID=A0A2G9I6Q7_9LAMI|nr:hypothetical protein CDL12_01807 [Handroanthus impetiginosus]
MKTKPLSSSSPQSSYNGGQESVPTSAGCIFKILRRILCFSSLAPSTFDHIQENEKENSLEIGGSDNLGIVARLMGLESRPESISSPQKRTRRIIPAYQELEDENFFILSFENSENITKKMKKVRRRRRRRESSKEMNNENADLNMISQGDLDLDSCIKNESDFKVEINPRKVLCPLKNSCQNSEKIRKNIDIKEGDSENSSPNSVLEFVDFSNDQETAAFSGDNSRFSNSKLRRTLSEELDNCGNSKDKGFINNGYGGQIKLGSKHQIYAENLDQISRLAAKEMINSRWVYEEISKNQHYFREIGRDISSEILDLLLDELLINMS